MLKCRIRVTRRDGHRSKSSGSEKAACWREDDEEVGLSEHPPPKEFPEGLSEKPPPDGMSAGSLGGSKVAAVESAFSTT